MNERQRERRRLLFELAGRDGRVARPPAAPIPGPTTSTRRSSTRRTTGGSAPSSAGSRSATTPGACTSTSASAAPTARSPSATAFATSCPILLAISANSPFLDGRDTGLRSVRTQIFTRTLPALRHPRSVRRLGDLRRVRRPARAHQLDRGVDPALVERPAPPQLRDGRGPDLRRAERRRASRFALAGLMIAAVAQAALDYDDGDARAAAAGARDRGEPVAGDPPRARRPHDRLRRRASRSPTCAAVEELLEWTAPAREQLGIDLGLRPTGPNGAQRSRASCEAGATIAETYRAAVALTADTFVAADPAPLRSSP